MENAGSNVHAVTGAFSYTGSYIARQLLAQGIGVRAFVRRKPPRDDRAIDCRALQFDDSERLTVDLSGCDVLYNTYWIRFERDGATFAGAVRNTSVLMGAARDAGVKRIVHLSVSNPSAGSPFAYFRGKAAAEEAVLDSGVHCSIVRPTLVFGNEDILINNIAWMLRRLHLFVLPGRGKYRVQPVFVDDVAGLAVEEALASGNRLLDAAGPETMTFASLIEALREAVRARAIVGRAPLPITLALGRAVSLALRDTVITREELGALKAETLVSSAPPTASTRLTEWAAMHAEILGSHYTSETRRHWSRGVR